MRPPHDLPERPDEGSDAHKTTVRLSHIHNGNWEKVLALKPQSEQIDFLPAAERALLEAHYQNLEARAIYANDTLVGYTTFGQMGHIFWVARIMIEGELQGNGYGSQALRLILAEMRRHPQCSEIRAAVDRRNALAEYLFISNGFERLGSDQHELILRYPV